MSSGNKPISQNKRIFIFVYSLMVVLVTGSSVGSLMSAAIASLFFGLIIGTVVGFLGLSIFSLKRHRKSRVLVSQKTDTPAPDSSFFKRNIIFLKEPSKDPLLLKKPEPALGVDTNSSSENSNALESSTEASSNPATHSDDSSKTP